MGGFGAWIRNKAVSRHTVGLFARDRGLCVLRPGSATLVQGRGGYRATGVSPSWKLSIDRGMLPPGGGIANCLAWESQPESGKTPWEKASERVKMQNAKCQTRRVTGTEYGSTRIHSLCVWLIEARA